MELSESRPFCKAPWVHSHIAVDGFRGLCCISIEEKVQKKASRVSFSEYWNGEYMKSVRTTMMSGEIPQQCRTCWQNGVNSTAYNKHFDSFQSWSDILAKTDEDGTTSIKPSSFDHRFSNLCNLKCQMCHPSSSSSLEIAYKRKDETSPQLGFINFDSLDKAKKFNREHSLPELVEAVEGGEIAEIYWCGGEPLMWPEHWRALHTLVESRRSHQVSLRYNTNLTRLSFLGQHIFDYFPSFKRVQFFVSMDGTGEVAELIRENLDWNQWCENLDSCLQFAKNHDNFEIAIDYTFTIIGLPHFFDFFRFALKTGCPIILKSCLVESTSTLMSPYLVPKSVLHPILDDLYEKILNLKEVESSRLRLHLQKVRNTIGSPEEVDLEVLFENAFPKSYQVALDFLQSMKNRPCGTDLMEPPRLLSQIREARQRLYYQTQIPDFDKKVKKVMMVYPDLVKWWDHPESFMS